LNAVHMLRGQPVHVSCLCAFAWDF
jgi:hypothetical protein